MTKKTAKTKVSDKTKELFLAYLEKKGLGVYNDAFMSSHYVIRPPKSASEKRSDYYAGDFLDSNLDNTGGTKYFVEFLTEILNKGEHEVALHQAIKKTPGPKNYEYSKHVNTILNTITPYKKTLFEYVARPRFLESGWEKLEDVFKTIDSQEHRKAIFEAMFATKTFTSLDVQKEIYNLVQKYIKYPSVYDEQFKRITKVDEKQNVTDFVSTSAVIIIGFNTEKLIGANLNTEVSSNALIESIKNISNSLKDNHQQDLGIINVMMDYKNGEKQHHLHVICPQDKVELNKIIFDRMINHLSRLNTWDEIKEFNEEGNRANFVKQCQSISLHNNLNSSLDAREEKTKLKNKI